MLFSIFELSFCQRLVQTIIQEQPLDVIVRVVALLHIRIDRVYDQAVLRVWIQPSFLHSDVEITITPIPLSMGFLQRRNRCEDLLLVFSLCMLLL